ncbi:MAG: 16S rRNA (cytosine(1402)-N(4))-methyltransferase, partial [Oscillospiraceae bacterium]|nr:16S rRNA (cytosine(1402)-N(4))-methyltransferase [Oscillospiraceae bacterium]
MEFNHIPVMLSECLEGLDIKPDGVYIDGTCGGAGHSKEIAKQLETGMLIGIDRDPDAVKTASERLEGLRATVVK